MSSLVFLPAALCWWAKKVIIIIIFVVFNPGDLYYLGYKK